MERDQGDSPKIKEYKYFWSVKNLKKNTFMQKRFQNKKYEIQSREIFERLKRI